MYVFPGGGSEGTKKEDTVEIEKKKQNIHLFQKEKKEKKEKEKRKERREIRGSTQCLPPSPVPPSKVSCLLSLVLAFIPLLPTYRPIPTDILPLLSSYIHGPMIYLGRYSR